MIAGSIQLPRPRKGKRREHNSSIRLSFFFLFTVLLGIQVSLKWNDRSKYIVGRGAKIDALPRYSHFFVIKKLLKKSDERYKAV